jgi:hypothetical protein
VHVWIVRLERAPAGQRIQDKCRQDLLDTWTPFIRRGTAARYALKLTQVLKRPCLYFEEYMISCLLLANEKDDCFGVTTVRHNTSLEIYLISIDEIGHGFVYDCMIPDVGLG